MVFDFIKRKKVFVQISLCSFCWALFFSFSTHVSNSISPPQVVFKSNAKSQWLDVAAKRIATIQSINEFSKVFSVQITSFDGFYKVEYQVKGEGFIVFENGDWIYFIPHSSHENEEIGDVTLAKDSQGNFYFNEGHICGGVISFYASDRNLKLDSYTFFNSFYSESDNKVWSRMILH